MTIPWAYKPLKGSKPRSWEDRRYAECAFPLDIQGVAHSCCDPVVPETPYCVAHKKIVYTGQPPKRVR